MEKQINVFGIILPDNSLLFLIIVGIHILAGMVCLVSVEALNQNQSIADFQ